MKINFSAISNRSALGKILRLPLRLIPSGTKVRIIQGPLKGKTWIVGSSNHGLWLGSYESRKQEAFSLMVRRGATVYDLGANVGFYSLLASVLVGPGGRVFSFEPVPRNLQLLRTHLALNRITNCSVLEAAVGRCEGTAGFNAEMGPSMGYMTENSDATFQVRTVTLDGLVLSGTLPPPNVIKCDIEGAEYDALVGAATILARFAPMIFLATHGPEVHQRCCKFLLNLGYQLQSLENMPLDDTSEVIAVREST
jgi:FkbM family methyltransferase